MSTVRDNITLNQITVVNPDATAVNVTQPTTAIVEVLTGPMGPKGDLPLSGSVNFTGSYDISGSLVVTGSITATQGITGSLQGTSSWAVNAETASYVNPLVQNVIITGSLTVSGSSTFTNIGPAIFSGSVLGIEGFTGSFLGDLTGTASYVEFTSVDGLTSYSSSISTRVSDLESFSSSLDATFATDAELAAATASLSASISSLSSSYLSTSASFSSGISANAGGIATLSSSFVSFSSSYNTGSYTGSFTGDGSGLYNIPASGIVGLNLNQITSGSVSASISPDKGLEINTNVTATSFTGSLSGTSSWASNAVTSSYAETASLAPAYLPLAGGTITGDLVVNGTASITYLSVTYESASVIYSSGSNQFGDAIDDTQTLFGSVIIPTGSLTVTGSVVSTTGFSGSLFGTSSWASNAISSSYALSASYAVSASHALNADNAISASYALTASYVNPLNQAVIITGSLNLTGSAVLTGSTVINGLTYPTADNGEFSFMQTDGLGNLTLQYVNTLYEVVYNGEATQITKGTPVYISGSQGANSKAYRADAGDPTKMPVVYIAADNINPSNTGRAIALGLITGVDTTGYPGGTEIYVGVGGGWTSARPTGSAIIQVLGYVTKEGNGGQGVVLNAGPANLPNILSGSVWVGNSGSVPTAVPTSSLSVASAVTASFAQTASLAPNYVLTSVTSSMLAPYVLTSQTSSMSVASASVATSASYALTASFALNGGGGAAFPFSGSAVISGSLFVSSSTTNVLTIQGSGSAQPIFTVQGSAGQLFAITDSLSGSLFSVNNVSGLPILEVFSDDTTLIGSYLAPALNTTARNTLTNSGSFTVYSMSTASYDGIFIEYTAKSGSNARAGNIMATWMGTTASFAETTTADIGDTSGLNFTVLVTGSSLLVTGSATAPAWVIKSIIKTI